MNPRRLKGHKLPACLFRAVKQIQFWPGHRPMKPTSRSTSKRIARMPPAQPCCHFRIIHFATHGWLNSDRPELSGVVLSLVNQKGQTQDGVLRLHEIYNLQLNADLVVLSACGTALGKEVRGEGLIGLTRGFMYAGAPRVAATLWKVDDAATAELMSNFYRFMLKEKLSPAAALRAAQLELLKQKRWHAPYFLGRLRPAGRMALKELQAKTRKKDWQLTQEGFDLLLSLLDHDRELAAEKYERLRRRLLKLFEWRGSPTPEEHADETFNRVARKISKASKLETSITLSAALRVTSSSRSSNSANANKRPLTSFPRPS